MLPTIRLAELIVPHLRRNSRLIIVVSELNSLSLVMLLYKNISLINYAGSLAYLVK